MRDKNFRILKIMVILMGVTLIFGVLFLITLIYQRNISGATGNVTAKGAASENSISSFVSRATSKEDCKGGNLDLGENGVIDQAYIKDDYLMIMLSLSGEDSSQKLIVVDYCNNKIISKVSVSK